MLTKPKKLGTGPSWALTHFLEEFVFSIDQTKFRCREETESEEKESVERRSRRAKR